MVIILASLIAILVPEEFVYYSVFMVCLAFIISIIIKIVKREWAKTFLSSMAFLFFFVIWAFFGLMAYLSSPRITIADHEFYSNEISKTVGLIVPKELKLVSKLDTIVFMGMEGEYDAECLYSGPEKIILDLEQKIRRREGFVKVNELGNYPTSVIKTNNFSVNDIKSIYKKEDFGRYIIHVAVDKNSSKLYYSAMHY
jgi:energy-coupling factor transporter transmembrane protein EcfT